MKLQESKSTRYKRIEKKQDRPGEAAKRRRMRALFGVNQRMAGDYDRDRAAVCRNGVFVGQREGDVLSFKGIPYAKPPVGERRWKAPEKAADSDDVWQAYFFGYSPIQTEWPSEEGSYYPQSEDCLTLNVWTSGTNSPARTGGKAVMVFFHGGSYGWGATSDPIYDGHNLVNAHKDIVLVTVEYRVGVMGFVDFSEVEGGEDFKESGNLGLLDHVCALEWVRDNIAAFGGDPANVTIFGESAGGGTVSLLAIMEKAKGLFRRVIAESGSVALTYSRKECKGLTERLLKASGAHTMRELMEIPEEELKRLNEELNDYNNFPERDGVVLPEDLYGAYQSGASRGVDIMIGTNADEVKYWIREMGYYSENWLGKTFFKLGVPLMYSNNLERLYPADRKSVDEYMGLFRSRMLWRIVAFYNDVLFRVPAIAEAQYHAAAGGKAYMYYWTYPSAHRNLGACHAVELAYVFNNPEVTIYTGNNVDPHLVKATHTLWTNFAKTGNPSSCDYTWLPYDEKERRTLVLGKKIKLESDPLPERREKAFPVLKYYFNGCYTNLSFNVPVIYKVAALLAAIVGFVPTVVLLIVRAVIKGIRKLRKRFFPREDD